MINDIIFMIVMMKNSQATSPHILTSFSGICSNKATKCARYWSFKPRFE